MAHSEVMIIIDPAPLEQAIAALLLRVEALPRCEDEALPADYEKLAKAITVQMKAVQDIYAHNQRVSEVEEQTKYLNYDELPPPSPEERAQFIKRLTHLYHRLNERSAISGSDSDLECP